MDGVFCNNCGHRNPSDANFCSSCGAVLSPGSPDATITLHPTDEGETTEDYPDVTSVEIPHGAGVLVVSRGPNIGARYLLAEDVVKAGRHPESDIFLDDITVSRRHVEISPANGGYSVRDVGSLNGTYVNRERIDEVPLAPGDEVQIGKFKLVYLVAGNE